VARYAAFLRGINVTGTRVKAADLCAPFEALGFEAVASFRASGNVVFDTPRRGGPKLARDIEARLASDLGFTKAVTFLRGRAQLEALAGRDPFGEGGKLQVMFLPKAPGAAVRKQVEALATSEDKLAFAEQELLWLPLAGVGGSTLDTKAIEKLVGPATTRTMGTVEQILAKYFQV
jgi:uncharacterized protein (DUF1697 family)